MIVSSRIKTTLLLLSMCFINNVYSQSTEVVNYITVKPKEPVDKTSWCTVMEEPSFPGGTIAWTKYLEDSTNYPNPVAGGRGKTVVVIRFIISKEGRVSEVQSIGSVQNSFTREAIRVISNSLQWNPAKRNGRSCSSALQQGFYFVWDPPTKHSIPIASSTCNVEQLTTMLLLETVSRLF